MAPDLNSLPTSQPSHEIAGQSPERRNVTSSNTEIHGSGSNDHFSSTHRPSSMQISHTSDRERRISLGQLHQEIENEQEAQVNRLLRMIRSQHEQLTALATEQHGVTMNEQSITPSELGIIDEAQLPIREATAASTHAPSLAIGRSSSRRSVQRTTSQSSSSAVGVTSDELALTRPRDETSFYQAETQNLSRENQMLRQRIQELERQLADASTTPSSAVAISPVSLGSMQQSKD